VNSRTVAAVGVLAALTYVGSMVMMVLPNATLSLLIVFFSGYLLGKYGGLLTGITASLLITLFNPYGLPLLPMIAAQVSGYAIVGLIGGMISTLLDSLNNKKKLVLLGLLGIVTALIYQIPVSLIDAWLFGPFQERLLMSGGFALITIISNLIFFVILFPPLAKLKKLGIFQLS